MSSKNGSKIKDRIESLRMEVSITKAGKGISLDSLVMISKNILDFLNNIGKDLGIIIKKGQWQASEFKDASVGYDLKRELLINDKRRYYERLRKIMAFDPYREDVDYTYNLDTLRAYAVIANPIIKGEKVVLSLYKNGEIDTNDIFELTKPKAKEINKKIGSFIAIEEPVEFEYYGGVQGIIYSWEKEADMPHLIIEDSSSGELVKCYYDNNIYSVIYKLFENKDDIIDVSGMVKLNRETEKIISLSISEVAVNRDSKYYQEGDLEKFIGCAPGLTKGLSPREYIERIRGEKESED